MRQFSDQEKQLIYAIYQSKDSNSYVLTNAFKEWFYNENNTINTAIGYDCEHGQLVFDLDKIKDSNSILDIQKEIIQTALLLKYLEDNGLIYIIEDDADTDNLWYIGKSTQQMGTPLRVNLPKDIANIINRSKCRIYVSYALTQFVENDFKTYEELQLIASNSQLETSSQQLSASEAQLEEARQQTEEAKAQTNEAKEQTSEAKKQTKKSTGTFVLSGLTFLASLIIPFIISKCNGDKVYHENVMTGIAQIDTTINETTNKITNHLDTIVLLERKSQNNDANIIQILNKQERHLKDINKQLKSR